MIRVPLTDDNDLPGLVFGRYHQIAYRPASRA